MRNLRLVEYALLLAVMLVLIGGLLPMWAQHVAASVVGGVGAVTLFVIGRLFFHAWRVEQWKRKRGLPLGEIPLRPADLPAGVAERAFSLAASSDGRWAGGWRS